MAAKVNFARLNHILIPATWEGRRAVQRRWYGRAFRGAAAVYGAFSEEGRTALLICLLAGFVGLDVQWTQAHLLWATLAGLILGALMVRPLFRLRGLRVDLDVPRRVTVNEPLGFSLEMHNRGEHALQALRVEGPFLPWDGQWLRGDRGVASIEAGEHHRLTLRATFSARGEHHLGPFATRALVPLGLTQGPALRSRDSRFLVLPRIAEVQSIAAPLELRYQPGGVAMASKTGESRELMGVRPYRPGDPVRDLHARTWGRTGEPMVREYQQEYFTRVGVILDTELTLREEARLEAAVSLCAGVLAHYSRGEALVDLLVVGDALHDLDAGQLTIGRSLGTLEQALDLLAMVGPESEPDLPGLANQLRPYLERLSTVIFVAVGWDASRATLLEEIHAHGVGCRVLLLREDDDDAALPGGIPGLAELRVSEVSAGEGGLRL